MSREIIYTLKLARRGHFMPDALRTNFLYLRPVRSIMVSPPAILPGSMPIDHFARMVSRGGDGPSFIVEDGESISGIISEKDALKALNAPPGMMLGDLAEKKFIIISGKSPLFEILRRMRTAEAAYAIVVAKGNPLTSANVSGFITREQIADLIEQSVAYYEE